jgi:hypothetical protein
LLATGATDEIEDGVEGFAGGGYSGPSGGCRGADMKPYVGPLFIGKIGRIDLIMHARVPNAISVLAKSTLAG